MVRGRQKFAEFKTNQDMHNVKEKKERALGTKLFLKAERCSSPKCAMVRKPYRPGVHGSKRHSVSEYGKQLQEKQKIQITYGLSNRQMRNLFRKFGTSMISVLERRLDRVVFLLGFARSGRVARQLISHGHILVNSRKVTIPSYSVKIGDVISIRPESRSIKIFEDMPLRLGQFKTPEWLKADKEEFKGECVGKPHMEETSFPFDINLVGQFYSR